ncbi:MAG: exo-alpha-sialidase, partial [Thermoplasmata archaeon]|nr:exo-alpha-sialidase [Thermoplasmata archaeon]
MSGCGRWRKAAVLCVLVLLSFATVLQAPPVGEEGFVGPENEGELGATPAETPSMVQAAIPPLPQLGTPRTRAPSGWSEDILLTNESDIYYSADPAVAICGDLVHVAYKDAWGTFPNTRAEVRYIHSDDGGENWAPAINMSLVDDEYSDLPDISVSGEHVYVAWADTRNAAREIYINISHDNGNTWEGEVNLSDIDGHLSNWPSVDANGSNVAVIWGDDRDVTGGANSVYMRLSTDNGTIWGPEQRVTNITDI